MRKNISEWLGLPLFQVKPNRKADFFDRNGHLTVDGTHRDIQQLRDFVVFESIFFCQLKYEFAPGWQHGNSSIDAVNQFGGD